MQTIPESRGASAEASFDEFARTRVNTLTRAAYRFTGDRHHAEDLVQTVLIRVAGHWQRIEDPDAYAMRTMYTQAVSLWRRRLHREIPVADPTLGSPLATDDPDADLRLLMATALARLTPKQRALLTLRFFEDRSESQVAEMLGIGLGTVKSQTRNALRRLRQLTPELRDLDPAGMPPESDPAYLARPAALPSDLYQRGRRAQRQRTTAAVTATTAAVGALLVLVAGLPGGSAVTSAAAKVADVVPLSERWASLATTVAWVVLAAVLGWLGLRWRRRLRPAATMRRLVATAVAGGLLILSAPPGSTIWGEPHRDTEGIPNSLVEPSLFTARASGQPNGRVAAAFIGAHTGGDLSEIWIAAAVAVDGPRYRFLQSPIISPDGRYTLEYDDGNVLVDLATGQRTRHFLGRDQRIAAWSADGGTLAYRDLGADTYGVWDFRRGRGLGEYRWHSFQHDEVGQVKSSTGAEANPLDTEAALALSPDGGRLAVQDGRRLLLYRIGEPSPYQQIDLPDAELAGTAAWTPDGRGVLLAVAGTCTVCPDPRYRRTWQLVTVDADTGRRLASPAYPVQTSVTRLEVLGWLGVGEPVVQARGTGPGLDPRSDAASSDGGRLAASEVSYENAGRQVQVVVVPSGGAPVRTFLTVPSGVTEVHLASDLLSRPTYQPGPATFGPPTANLGELVMLTVMLSIPLAVLALLVAAVVKIIRVRRRRTAGPAATGWRPIT